MIASSQGAGLVNSNDGVVQNRYFTGRLFASKGGSLVSYTGSGATAINCYAAGEMFGPIGLYDYSIIQHAYYDNNLACNWAYTDENASATARMKQRETYEDWDFEEVWGFRLHISSGYSHLLRNN